MARPRTFTDKQVRALHAKNKTVQEIACELETSIVTIYKYLRRLGLKSNNGNDRLDLRKFSDDDFRRAHSAHDGNASEIANTLKVSPPTVVRHAELLDLKLKRQAVELSLSIKQKVFNAYQALNSIRDISKEYDLTPSLVRKALDKEIAHIWATKQRLPRPTNLDEIKLYHLFRKFPSAIEQSTETITTQAGHVRGTSVISYLNRLRKTK